MIENKKIIKLDPGLPEGWKEATTDGQKPKRADGKKMVEKMYDEKKDAEKTLFPRTIDRLNLSVNAGFINTSESSILYERTEELIREIKNKKRE